MGEELIDGIDREQAERIAASLEELQLKLHGGQFNDYRLAVLCGAAAIRALPPAPQGVSKPEMWEDSIDYNADGSVRERYCGPVRSSKADSAIDGSNLPGGATGGSFC